MASIVYGMTKVACLRSGAANVVPGLQIPSQIRSLSTQERA